VAEWLEADTLAAWVAGRAAGVAETIVEASPRPSTLRARLQRMPPFHIPNLWLNKVEALLNLERSLADDRPRALIQMATGSGKTLLAVTALYPDEPLAYKASDLDRSVVARDQIRLIVRTFKERLFTEIFPGRTQVDTQKARVGY
jgi:hypothetical protein